ncbi:MAG: uracil phosphoribosyltransferase, partial [Clostridia bacterium]|nr:uracil phosphoribosyltransferase [Clostridia bacterium]
MENTFKNLSVCTHPLLQEKLTLLRNKETGAKDFRELVSEIAMFVTYEATRDLELKDTVIETPMAKAVTKTLAKKPPVIVPILRAGLGMVEGVHSLMPTSKVGHIGLYRDPRTKLPVTYYCKLPAEISRGDAIILDPMLATGGSSIAAIDLLKKHDVKNIKLMCIIAAPEGVAAVENAHPDVKMFTASLDERLDDHCYIIPGLGDAGDRI